MSDKVGNVPLCFYARGWVANKMCGQKWNENMKYTVKVYVAKGSATDFTPPREEFKQLIELTSESSAHSIEELGSAAIVREMEEICCRPTMLVTGQWGTPYESPLEIKTDVEYHKYKRYDWGLQHTLWMYVLIQKQEGFS